MVTYRQAEIRALYEEHGSKRKVAQILRITPQSVMYALDPEHFNKKRRGKTRSGRSREASRRSYLKHFYGVSPEILDEVLDSGQNGVCFPLCGEEISFSVPSTHPFRAVVDHRGKRGVPCPPAEIRSILCAEDNRNLPWAERKGILPRNWQDYLISHPHAKLIEKLCREAGLPFSREEWEEERRKSEP